MVVGGDIWLLVVGCLVGCLFVLFLCYFVLLVDRKGHIKQLHATTLMTQKLMFVQLFLH